MSVLAYYDDKLEYGVDLCAAFQQMMSDDDVLAEAIDSALGDRLGDAKSRSWQETSGLLDLSCERCGLLALATAVLASVHEDDGRVGAAEDMLEAYKGLSVLRLALREQSTGLSALPPDPLAESAHLLPRGIAALSARGGDGGFDIAEAVGQAGASTAGADEQGRMDAIEWAESQLSDAEILLLVSGTDYSDDYGWCESFMESELEGRADGLADALEEFLPGIDERCEAARRSAAESIAAASAVLFAEPCEDVDAGAEGAADGDDDWDFEDDPDFTEAAVAAVAPAGTASHRRRSKPESVPAENIGILNSYPEKFPVTAERLHQALETSPNPFADIAADVDELASSVRAVPKMRGRTETRLRGFEDLEMWCRNLVALAALAAATLGGEGRDDVAARVVKPLCSAHQALYAEMGIAIADVFPSILNAPSGYELESAAHLEATVARTEAELASIKAAIAPLTPEQRKSEEVRRLALRYQYLRSDLRFFKFKQDVLVLPQVKLIADPPAVREMSLDAWIGASGLKPVYDFAWDADAASAPVFDASALSSRLKLFKDTFTSWAVFTPNRDNGDDTMTVLSEWVVARVSGAMAALEPDDEFFG